MENLIRNSVWDPGVGGPRFFTNNGPITYDDFSLNGFRTCSLTMPADSGLIASNVYDIPICLCGFGGASALHWGYLIRVIDKTSIVLVANFYDGDGVLVKHSRADITRHVTYRFSRIMGRFPVPPNARTARLSIEFSGKTTACTFCAPKACLQVACRCYRLPADQICGEPPFEGGKPFPPAATPPFYQQPDTNLPFDQRPDTNPPSDQRPAVPPNAISPESASPPPESPLAPIITLPAN